MSDLQTLEKNLPKDYLSVMSQVFQSWLALTSAPFEIQRKTATLSPFLFTRDIHQIIVLAYSYIGDYLKNMHFL